MTRWNALPLLMHPSAPAHAPQLAVAADLYRHGWGFELHYRVSAARNVLKMPPTSAGSRLDGLWRHTCFELFIGPSDSPPYVELNASPSGDWALYRFSDYRMAVDPWEADAPIIRAQWRETDLQVSITLQTSTWNLPWLSGSVRVGLSAVLEGSDGGLAYYALEHPREQPDFHDARAWRQLPAPMDTGDTAC